MPSAAKTHDSAWLGATSSYSHTRSKQTKVPQPLNSPTSSLIGQYALQQPNLVPSLPDGHGGMEAAEWRLEGGMAAVNQPCSPAAVLPKGTSHLLPQPSSSAFLATPGALTPPQPQPDLHAASSSGTVTDPAWPENYPQLEMDMDVDTPQHASRMPESAPGLALDLDLSALATPAALVRPGVNMALLRERFLVVKAKPELNQGY